MWFPYWWNRCRFFFFHNFLDVYVVKVRVLRLSKDLFRNTRSTKDLNIVYQSYKLTAELHLTLKDILFILELLNLIKKSYDNTSKTLFIPYPIPKATQQSSFFLHLFKDFQCSKSSLIRFRIRFPEICLEKLLIFELSPQIFIKNKELDYLLKNQQFSIN